MTEPAQHTKFVLHRPSIFPASRGDHKGRYYCLECTVAVDDFMAYVDWPCRTAVARRRRGRMTERELREIADRHCASGHCDTHPCDVARLVAEVRHLTALIDGVVDGE